MATPLAPGAPTCNACGNTAVVNWLRRPTDAEFAEVIANEEARRDALLDLSNKELPPPEFGPLPTVEGMTRTVYGCAQHAITLDDAALIHRSTCTAPNPDNLPGCDCTPETPEPEAPPVVADNLPDHWVTSS